MENDSSKINIDSLYRNLKSKASGEVKKTIGDHEIKLSKITDNKLKLTISKSDSNSSLSEYESEVSVDTNDNIPASYEELQNLVASILTTNGKVLLASFHISVVKNFVCEALKHLNETSKLDDSFMETKCGKNLQLSPNNHNEFPPRDFIKLDLAILNCFNPALLGKYIEAYFKNWIDEKWTADSIISHLQAEANSKVFVDYIYNALSNSNDINTFNSELFSGAPIQQIKATVSALMNYRNNIKKMKF